MKMEKLLLLKKMEQKTKKILMAMNLQKQKPMKKVIQNISTRRKKILQKQLQNLQMKKVNLSQKVKMVKNLIKILKAMNM